MAKKTYSVAEFVDLLRQAEVHLSQGMTIAGVNSPYNNTKRK